VEADQFPFADLGEGDQEGITGEADADADGVVCLQQSVEFVRDIGGYPFEIVGVVGDGSGQFIVLDRSICIEVVGELESTAHRIDREDLHLLQIVSQITLGITDHPAHTRVSAIDAGIKDHLTGGDFIEIDREREVAVDSFRNRLNRADRGLEV